MKVRYFLIFAALAVAIPHSCLAKWQTEGNWKVTSDYTLSVSCTDEGFAWNSIQPQSTWAFSGDMKIVKGAKGNSCARLAFGNAKRKAVVLVSIEHLDSGLTAVSADKFDGEWHRILSSGWMPGADSSFYITVSRITDSMNIAVAGNKGFYYSEETVPIDPSVWSTGVYYGVGAYASDVEFSGLKFETPYSPPGHYTALAQSAVQDLLKNYWTGGPDDGCIAPTYSGYTAPVLPMPRGGMWERGMMTFALDSYYRATGDAVTKRRIKAEWARMKRIYTKEELTSAGGQIHPACDDSGWDASLYMVFYRHLGDPYALECAKGLVDSAYNRWHDDTLGGSIWYDNSRKHKSLYQIGLVNCAMDIWRVSGDKHFHDIAMSCYDWMESHLLRPDGIYWADLGVDGPAGVERPDDIHEGGSVSFLAGNMGMAILHAKLYRATGDKKYLDRALRTADGMSRKFLKDGVYMDDRDAWANGTFAADWAQEVLTLPGIDPKHKALFFKTADAVYANDRTPDGYYGGCWNGPVDGPGSRWSMNGSRPQQIMTSASTANMVIAAAILENNRSPLAVFGGSRRGAE
jgi:predicted alpha-1,6-mannanase (GH76 family)